MILIALALQAATPDQAEPASNSSAAVQPASEQADAPVEQPKTKLVCRRVMDPRSPALSAGQKVCKEVPIQRAPKGH